MPSREFTLRVQDMLAEVAAIEESVSGRDFEAFSQNWQAVRAVLYSLAVIGEAVASVMTELEAAEPSIAWHQIRGMRHAVIHEYFRVDLEIIWETVRSDLPVLREALQRVLKAT